MKQLLVIFFALSCSYFANSQIKAEIGLLFPNNINKITSINIGNDFFIKNRLTFGLYTGYTSAIYSSEANSRLFEFDRIPIEFRFYFPNKYGKDVQYAAFMGLNFNTSFLTYNSINSNLEFTNFGFGLSYGAKLYLADGIEMSIMGILNRDFRTIYKGGVNRQSYFFDESGVRIVLGYDIKKLINSVKNLKNKRSKDL